MGDSMIAIALAFTFIETLGKNSHFKSFDLAVVTSATNGAACLVTMGNFRLVGTVR